MTVLFVATRSPWPSIDGGRVLMAQTIAGLCGRGHRVTVVAPDSGDAAGPPAGTAGLQIRLVRARPRGWLASHLRSHATRRPTTIERHWQPALAREIDRCLRDGADVVHVQQLHALVNVAPVAGREVPIVLRAENVEVDLWRQTIARAWGSAAGWSSSRRLGRWETDALDRVASTAAVSGRDATALRRLAPLAAVDVVRIPMPAVLPAGPRLAGDPAIVLLAGAWRPNRDGASWFLRSIWPEVAAALPAARLHVFGDAGGGAARTRSVEVHPPPSSSIAAFPEGAVAVVPLRIASGASVRILEAWARGQAVVTTPIAAGGVVDAAAAGHQPAVAVASTAAAFIAAFGRLSDPDARRRAVDAGRAVLAARHDPDVLAASLERVYETAIDAVSRRGDR